MGTRIVVIGGGISGLLAAFCIREGAARTGQDIELTVLESEDRLGGKIWSIRDQGFLCEYGPNGFLDNKPLTLELCKRLGVSGRLLKSRDQARKRFIYSGGKLHALPESPPAFFKSGLLSLRGRLRIIGELWARKAPKDRDETLADFARRRLGQEALDKLIGPMVSGIFAGDPEQMSLKSCFPRIAELEAEYGSLIRAMIKIQKKKRTEGEAKAPQAGPAGPGGILTSFAGGLEDLVHALRDALSGSIQVSCKVSRIQRGLKGEPPFRIQVENQSAPIPAKIVVSAVPAYAAARILSGLSDQASDTLRQIPYAPVSVICLGYRKESIPISVDGFGFLIPNQENKKILGTLWDSSIFPGRAPEGYVSLRSMAGGARHPEYALANPDEILAGARQTLKEIMGIQAAPKFVKIFQHKEAIPQYTVGHGKRLSALEQILAEDHPGLFLTGNAFYGIGINDCVESAERAAERVMAFIKKA
ncbi:MAG: protoporphyrinogen oxidase [Nitrospirae bacterium CG_4_9_14_3_um_filter_53_35]|nr:MAG: protoporphyrinogen oxidase [Nitrospirae bacterium CG2_30_53_67]PIS36764.1 MAG: protoporphyrinogen oxidase [Nitrospirae bacterium CG08_land_8_20_14_0_20_52_24]PIV82519.1 MAG: protoporphyrinogen oxidase [Nitrospirae bacterium CG17_big_fil_post_rev_8_21_14_2_50_50_9]PIW84939.1 MAG: protoporphyrinogen oxidase [Nitrospirae bacterium CG_4_8_14_3_um_filter_50_41]PIX86841.1 MAG: protoporphyrinogen oxidase [Nitrospirae bacterium CG_4_10_14_3_um_filter_53_41]PJA77463.1 MAG: protoporphyrinogen ox